MINIYFKLQLMLALDVRKHHGEQKDRIAAASLLAKDWRKGGALNVDAVETHANKYKEKGAARKSVL